MAHILTTTTEGLELCESFDACSGVWDACSQLEHFAARQATNGAERAVVELVIIAGFEKFIAPRIRDYVKPNIFDGLAVAAGKSLVLYIAMAAYDQIRGD